MSTKSKSAKKPATKTTPKASPKPIKPSASAARADGAAKLDRARAAALAEIQGGSANAQRKQPKAAAKAATRAATIAATPAANDAPATEAPATADAAAASQRPAKAQRVPKPKAEPKPKRMSALDAAATVIVTATGPMRASELIAKMQADGLWTSPGGKTPEATLYAAIIREIAAKGDAARFKKADRGLFVAPTATLTPITPVTTGEAA
jgi:hypothetical protein